MTHPLTENVMRAYEWHNSKLTQDPLECIGQHRNEYECEDPDGVPFYDFGFLLKLFKSTLDRANCHGQIRLDYSHNSGVENSNIYYYLDGDYSDDICQRYFNPADILDEMLKAVDGIVALNPSRFAYPVVPE